MKRNRTVWGLVAALAGVALLLGGVAVASNMGFKFVPVIPGAAVLNAFNLSLPWNNNFTNAASLFDGVAAYGPISAVQKFGADSSLAAWYGPGTFSNNFTINKGEAYIVSGAGPGDVHPVIVGSHDPNFTMTFVAGATNASAPYHQTYVNAAGLFDAVKATCPNLASVQKFGADSSLAAWYGPVTYSNNFALDLGMGVIVNTTTQCAGFVWAHY